MATCSYLIYGSGHTLLPIFIAMLWPHAARQMTTVATSCYPSFNVSTGCYPSCKLKVVMKTDMATAMPPKLILSQVAEGVAKESGLRQIFKKKNLGMDQAW